MTAGRSRSALPRQPASGVLARTGSPEQRAQNEAIHEPLRPTTGTPQIVQDALRSPGRPLSFDTRAAMNLRFGQDFSGVRVHTGETAAEAAAAVNANAFTAGNH